jgi:hypothetical protein
MKPPTGTPCSECPWRRASLPGWLGPHTAEEWQLGAHGDHEIACHLTIPAGFDDDDEAGDDTSMMTTCSGAAIFRANVCKSPRYVPAENRLPADRETVFGHGEFLAHHTVKRTRVLP